MKRKNIGTVMGMLAAAGVLVAMSPGQAKADHRTCGYIGYGPRYVSPAPVYYSIPSYGYSAPTYASYAPVYPSYTPTYSTYTPTYVRETPSYANFAATVYSPSTYHAPVRVVYERPTYYRRPVVYAPRPVVYSRPVVVGRPAYASRHAYIRPYYSPTRSSFGFGYSRTHHHGSHQGGFSVRIGR